MSLVLTPKLSEGADTIPLSEAQSLQTLSGATASTASPEAETTVSPLPPLPPPVVDDVVSIADSIAEWTNDFLTLFEENKVNCIAEWHLRKSTLPPACRSYLNRSLSLARGNLLTDMSEVNQLLTIAVGIGHLVGNCKKSTECLQLIKPMSRETQQIFEYFTYMYSDDDIFISGVAQEIFDSPSDPYLLHSYCNFTAWNELQEKNYAKAIDLYMESLEHNPRGFRIVFYVIKHLYLGAPQPWFSMEKARSLMLSTMNLVRDENIVLTLLKEQFIRIILAPEYWYCKECVKVKGRKLSTSERNRLNARKTAVLDKAAEFGYVEADFKHYLSDAGGLVYEVKGTDKARKAWYMVLVDPEKRGEFLLRLDDDIIHLEDHGIILKSAYGDKAPENVLREVKDRFEIEKADLVQTHPLHVSSVLLDEFNTFTTSCNATTAG
jgi:hypothetical protein